MNPRADSRLAEDVVTDAISRRLTQAILVLTFALVALASLAAFAPDRLLELDRPLARDLRGENLRVALDTLTRAGSQRLALGISAVAGLFVWRRCRPLTVLLPAALAIGILSDVGLKISIDRPRPPEPVIGTSLGSFPSGHVITATILFGLLPAVILVITRNRMMSWSAAVMFPVAVAIVSYSRIYLGAHWPTDVLGGVLVGLIIVLGTYRILGGAAVGRRCVRCELHRRMSPRAPSAIPAVSERELLGS